MFPSTVSQEKEKKARLKERAILLVEQKGWDIEKAFGHYGLKISPFSYPGILSGYQKGGWQNLIDTRGGNRHPKATPTILDFIRRVKRQNPTQSAKEIGLLLEERFQISFHPIYIGAQQSARSKDTEKDKLSVANRTLARKRQQLEDIIVAKEAKVHKADAILKQAQRRLEQAQESYQTISQKIEKELKDVTSRLSQAPSRTIRLLRRQSKLLGQKEKAKEDWLKKQAGLNSTIQEKTALIHSHQKTLKKAQKKLSQLPAEERLYEIDTSKDQFMTDLEVALANADPYFKEHFLPAPYKRYDFKSIRSARI